MKNNSLIVPSGSVLISEEEMTYVDGGCACSSTYTSNGNTTSYVCKYHCYYMGEMYQKIGNHLVTAAQAISQYGTSLGPVGKGLAELAAFTCAISAWRFLSEGKIYSSVGTTASSGKNVKGVRMYMAAGTTTYSLTTC